MINNLQQAKQVVKKHMDSIKEGGYSPNLVDINYCINLLREGGFYIAIDGSNKIIGDVLMDYEGNPSFSVIG